MSSICGIVRRGGAPIDPLAIDAMVTRLDHWSADAREMWRGDSVALGGLLLRMAPDGVSDGLIVHDGEANCSIAGDCRIDNRAPLANELGLAATQIERWSDSQLVLRAYREWGEACVSRLLGEFAFAIWDGRHRRLVCARDPFGIRPFYYFDDPSGFAFASEIKGLLALDMVDRSIDELWVCDYLLNMMLERDATMYARIRRLDPAHLLIVSESGTRKRCYWSPDLQHEIRLSNDQEYIDAFLERLRVAVGRCLHTPNEIGAELSGGLDSSGVCALALPLVRASGRDLHTFSQVAASDEQEFIISQDGRPAIEAVCRHIGVTNKHLLSGEEIGSIDALDWVTRYCDEPPRFLLGLWNDLTYSAAIASGVRVLLSGFGGNQGVTSAAAHRREELLSAGRFGELWRDLKGSSSSPIPLRGIGGLLLRNVASDWLRFRDPSVKSFFNKLPHRPLRDSVRAKWKVHDRAIEFFRLYEARGSVRECIARSLAAPNVSIRLEFSQMATTARRVQYRYPLLDRELIELYLATPSHLKQRNGVGRYLFRRSMQGLLPEHVQWSSPRASATPSSPRRKERDATPLRERIASMPSDSRVFEYVDPKKLETTFVIHMKGGAWRWAREGDAIKVLILDQKLREASNPVAQHA